MKVSHPCQNSCWKFFTSTPDLNRVHLNQIGKLIYSTSISLAKQDPQDFVTKVIRFFRLAGIPGAQKVELGLRKVNAHVTKGASTNYLRVGQLKKAIAPENIATHTDAVAARRAESALKVLQISIPVGRKTLRPDQNKLKVLYVLTNSLPYTQSGYTVRSHEILRILNRQGHDAEAVTRIAYPVTIGKIPSSYIDTVDGVCYHRLLPNRFPADAVDRIDLAVDMLVKKASDLNVSVLHTTTDYTNAIIVSRAAEILGVPWIYEVRGELESTWLSRLPNPEQEAAKSSDFYVLSQAKETQAMQSASAVIALSEIAKEKFIGRGVPSEKIHVIPNAVDSDLLSKRFSKRQVRAELGLDKDTFLVGTVTSLVEYEGLDCLIKSLQLLPDAHCLIVGDGAARPDLEDLARDIGVASRVTFVGKKPLKDIWYWYSVLDVFVVPRKDTEVCRSVTPIKPLTAQALGIPVVASNLPALREVTGNFAHYVEADNPRSLALGIEAARKSSNTDRGIEWAANRTWTQIGFDLFKVYSSLVPR